LSAARVKAKDAKAWLTPFAPDLVVLTFKEDLTKLLPGTKPATVRLMPTSVGTPVTIVGYGCHIGPGSEDASNIDLKLRFGSSRIESLTSLQREFYEDASAEKVSHYAWVQWWNPAAYYYTAGVALRTTVAGCPGDSGGPMLNERQEVLGVYVNGYNINEKLQNKDFRYRPDFDWSEAKKMGLQVYHGYERLDSKSLSDSGSWIASQGVNVSDPSLVSHHYENCTYEEKSGYPLCSTFLAQYPANREKWGAPTGAAFYDQRLPGHPWVQPFEKVLVIEKEKGVLETMQPVPVDPDIVVPLKHLLDLCGVGSCTMAASGFFAKSQTRVHNPVDLTARPRPRVLGRLR
jgi:Trypsin